MNIFYESDDFVNLDNRRLRQDYKLTFQSLFHKISAQLPKDIIKNLTVLDLGSCLAAAGYYSLFFGAAHYTGVEIQDFYYDTSIKLLNQHFNQEKFLIIKEDITNFLDSTDQKFDVVLASGILYGFLDPIILLEKLTKVTKKYLIIDTRYVPVRQKDPENGIVLIQRKEKMVKVSNSDAHDFFEGVGSRISTTALDIVLNTLGFELEEEVKVDPITDTFDPYNTILKHSNGSFGPLNYIVRYKNTCKKTKTLQTKIIEHGQFQLPK